MLNSVDGLPVLAVDIDGLRFECILDNMSIFSSFSSSKSFNSRTSDSKFLTLSSKLSVYPLGNALRLSLSLVLHSKPTFEHCEQHGRMPSQRIFLLRQRSHACAILLCALCPTLITFIGSIPGMLVIFPILRGVRCGRCASVLPVVRMVLIQLIKQRHRWILLHRMIPLDLICFVSKLKFRRAAKRCFFGFPV